MQNAANKKLSPSYYEKLVIFMMQKEICLASYNAYKIHLQYIIGKYVYLIIQNWRDERTYGHPPRKYFPWKISQISFGLKNALIGEKVAQN